MDVHRRHAVWGALCWLAVACGSTPQDDAADRIGEYCIRPGGIDDAEASAAYDLWRQTTVTADGAGGFLRIRKPDSGTVIGSTVSEGIGYGMILAVAFDDQELFDNLWKYEQLYPDSRGLMNWEVDPNGDVIGNGAATDGDEDMAWALLMADVRWGGAGTLSGTYLAFALDLIERIWLYEVDHTRNEMLKAGDQWGVQNVTNPSYFAPAYFRLFAEVSGRGAEWNQVIETNYDILDKSLNEQSGNQDNGLVPAWCDSEGTPVEAFAGAPLHFQNDSSRTPFRIGQDYCWFGEPRAKAYLDKIVGFYEGVGIDGIVDGYELDGTPRPENAVDGKQAASFIGPAGVGAMSDESHRAFVDAAYRKLSTLSLMAGTQYYQTSWTALSLAMMTGSLADWTRFPP